MDLVKSFAKTKRICKSCGKKFIPKQWNQFYCGSKIKKIGCSYKMRIKGITKYNLGKNKEYMKKYIKEWAKKQRKDDTDYATRQRESKRVYAKNPDKKEIIKNWRHKNIKKILEWNRKRNMFQKGVIGSHTNKEWEDLKKYYDFRCVKCGKSEQQLKVEWKGTNFDKLTKDHIVPISRGGTDHIWNIQPLCVSCNSRKHKIKNEKIVAVSMGADPIHIGHLRHIFDAKSLGDRLIVILNNDNWLKNKKGFVFMSENERAQVLMAVKGVDGVILTKHKLGDEDVSVAHELEIIKPDVFAKGGDRNFENIPEREKEICKKFNIKVVGNVGGGKVQSSSWLIKNASEKNTKFS